MIHSVLPIEVVLLLLLGLPSKSTIAVFCLKIKTAEFVFGSIVVVDIIIVFVVGDVVAVIAVVTMAVVVEVIVFFV